jgi:hypothetical protein
MEPPFSTYQRVFGLLTLVNAGLLLAGCTAPNATIQTNDPELATYLELVLPARIEIQRYLTKPVSYAGDGNADGLEVILAVYDKSEELTKVYGTLHFELVSRKITESVGTRVAFWPVDIKTDKAMHLYRDHLSRFYQFPLQLDQKSLPAGTYVLAVWLHLPGDRRLYDEYEFTYDGSGAPPVRPL